MFFKYCFAFLKHGSLWGYRLATWAVLAAGVLFVASVLALRYWLLPAIDQFRAPIVHAIAQAVGQPVIIPGDMGRYSFVLIGAEGAMRHAFGSTCHGAGRQMSRTQSVRETKGRDLVAELREAGVVVRYEGRDTLREETSEAYKDVAEVVKVCEGAGLAKPVAKLVPFLVVKG